jgi:hypothetical protein
MNSKQSISLLILIVAVFVLIIGAAYVLNQRDANSYTDSNGKYKMHVSYSLENGSYSDSSYSSDNGPVEFRMRLSYIVTIRGTKEDIGNIDSYQTMLNMNYLEHGFYNNEHVSNVLLGNGLQFKGYVYFDTEGMVKDVSATDILEGIEIYDKDGNTYMLYFN